MSDDTKKPETCPRCEMDQKMIGLSMAHVSCGVIKDETKRGECNEWAAGIDPSKMSAMEIMEEVYDRAGIDGISRFPEMHKKMVMKLIIKKVGAKLDRKEPVTEEEMELYKRYTKEEVKQGL